jgi:flagellar biogenesis protein FliO
MKIKMITIIVGMAFLSLNAQEKAEAVEAPATPVAVKEKVVVPEIPATTETGKNATEVSENASVSKTETETADESAPETKHEKRRWKTKQAREKEGSVSSLGVSTPRILLALVVVGGLMGGFFYYLKKYGRNFTGTEKSVIGLAVKNRLSLDAKNSVVIVRAYEEELVLGLGTNGITLLTKYSAIDGSEIDEDEEKIDNQTKMSMNPLLTEFKLGSTIDSEDLKTVKSSGDIL